jgi:hypothetical protein
VLEIDFEKMPFEKAVQLFEEWGFLMEPGPRPGEVTIMLEGPPRHSYCVCESEKLPEMAAAILRVRWRNGTMVPRVGCVAEIRA